MIWRRFFFIKIKRPVFFAVATLFFGILISFCSFNDIIPLLGKRFYPLKGFKIVIDPGHGGIDGGTHYKKQVLEKDLNLAVALKLRDVLKAEGARVTVTRATDTELSHLNDESSSRHQRDLLARLRIIERELPDLFVSIHVNSLPSSPVTRGPMVFYGRKVKESRILAHFVQESLNSIQFEGDRFQQKQNRFLQGEFFLLRNAPCPGVIVELGFLSNPTDRAYLQRPDYQLVLALAIKEGIKQFLYYTRKPRM
jgi:N-acetylmuramoyl-L-alanine amidase